MLPKYLWLRCKVEKSYTEQNYQRILFLLISDILLNCTDDCMTQAVTATLTYKNANEEDEESRKQAYLKECNRFENFHCTQVRRVQYNIHTCTYECGCVELELRYISFKTSPFFINLRMIYLKKSREGIDIIRLLWHNSISFKCMR